VCTIVGSITSSAAVCAWSALVVSGSTVKPIPHTHTVATRHGMPPHLMTWNCLTITWDVAASHREQNYWRCDIKCGTSCNNIFDLLQTSNFSNLWRAAACHNMLYETFKVAKFCVLQLYNYETVKLCFVSHHIAINGIIHHCEADGNKLLLPYRRNVRIIMLLLSC